MIFGGVFDPAGSESRLKALLRELENPEIWQNQQRLQALSQEKSRLERAVSEWKALESSLSESRLLLELVEEEKDEAGFSDLKKDIARFAEALEKKEIESRLSGENDHCSSYLSIHAGAGGTEAADWARILHRMYLRWAEKHGFQTEILSLTEGEEAGLKSVSCLIKGPCCYGQLKEESGVHRLVRISPFDSSSRRHTSFASVFAWPEADDKIQIEISQSDIRVDTYRSSGAGGQHVNTTDSAVRITHLPTGAVVQCQNQRSQHANKDKAMKMLRAALYKKELEKKEEEKARRESSKKANEWGSQIRSYILHPYQMVKDHKTQTESSSPKAVLDGGIDVFIQAGLRRKSRRPPA